MNYSNGNSPQIGDTIVGGPYVGQCKVISIDKLNHSIGLRNIMTNQVFDYDMINDLDLVEATPPKKSFQLLITCTPRCRRFYIDGRRVSQEKFELTQIGPYKRQDCLSARQDIKRGIFRQYSVLTFLPVPR